MEYDYGNNYNPTTGVYTVPRDGLYVVHARVRGRDKTASHFIMVNGTRVTYTREHDPDDEHPSGSTSIILHLLLGQEVTVEPNFTGTVAGNAAYMSTSFGAILIYAD